MTIQNSKFDGNTLTDLYPDVESRDIHNLGAIGLLPVVDARNNQWTGNPGIDDVNGDGNSIQYNPTLSYDPLATTACSILPPNKPEQLLINELATYGITTFIDGLPDTDPSYATHTMSWEISGLQEILSGTQVTAQAFTTIRPGANPKTLFQRIMEPFTILRVKNGYTGLLGCNTPATPSNRACTDASAAKMAFYSDLPLSQIYLTPIRYTFVHEMGHLFNYRSDSGNGRSATSLYGRMENITIYDYGTQSRLLFGIRSIPLTSTEKIEADNLGIPTYMANGTWYVNDWVRGDRGWGSGPASSLPTNFQQNSFTVDWRAYGSQSAQAEVDEAAADMFLNWVYRANSQGGFQNTDWFSEGCRTPQGCSDSSRPGDRRYEWLKYEIEAIFSQRGW